MIKQRLKIISILLISFLLANLISHYFFVFFTPSLRKNALNYLIKDLTKTLPKINYHFFSISVSPTPSVNFYRKKLITFDKIWSTPTLTPTLTPTPLPKPTLWTPTPPASFFTNVPIDKLSRTVKPTIQPTISRTQTLSSSKLAPFILTNYSSGAKKIVSSGPRLIKVLEPQAIPSVMEAVIFYKKHFPSGITVLRIWQGTTDKKYSLSDDPRISAEDFFERVNRPAFNNLGNNLSYFDYIQTPNEFETTPEWWGSEKVRWNGQFWKRLTELNKNYGIRTCVGGIPVGNLEASDLGFIIDDLRAIKNMGGAFCYHSYTFNYSTDVNYEKSYSLRYRLFYEYFANYAPDLVFLPLILSEGGVAENGNPYHGYLVNNNHNKYKEWLVWFDQQIRADPYVVGVTLFQIGEESTWRYFNLEPLADWLADYLKR